MAHNAFHLSNRVKQAFAKWFAKDNQDITTTALTDVAGKATAKVVDANLVAGNIKKDVTILGVTGTYEA